MDMALIIFWMPDSWLNIGANSGFFSLHAGPIYSTGNLIKPPLMLIFNVFKYILCRMDMALLIIRILNGLLKSGSVSGIFSLHAGPIYSSGNQVQLLFLPIFYIFSTYLSIFCAVWTWH